MNSTDDTPRPWYLRIGPAIITACVVIGPGSIMTSSNVGAKNGYGLSWVVIGSVIFMLTYMTMGARIGVFGNGSPGALLTKNLGRWFAALIGLSVFFIASSFQFGNNLGVHYALETYVDFEYIIVLFNVLAISFLLFAKNLYRALEKLMMIFVGIMLASFAVNLLFAGPRFGEWAQGFIPNGFGQLDFNVLALVGTTLVTPAAFYQAYLVRQKGLTPSQLPDTVIDARIGACVMAAITLMLMATPATVFHPIYQHQKIVSDPGESSLKKGTLVIVDREGIAAPAEVREKAEKEVDWKTDESKWPAIITEAEFNAAKESLPKDKQPQLSDRSFSKIPEVGLSLEPLFGKLGPLLFFLGVFAAAYSSFLVNSMIGGFMLADGLGLGDSPDDKWPRIFTVTALLTGMGVALYVIVVLKGQNPVPLIVAAQAMTVIASPLVAGALLYLSCNREVMGEHTCGPLLKVLGIVGVLLLLVMSYNVAVNKVAPQLFG